LFNFFKKFRQKNKLSGFSYGNHSVTVSQVEIEFGRVITYTCSFLDYIISFDYNDYAGVINQLGVSTISYKNTVICKEHHNLTISGLTPEDYLKKYFQKAIDYSQKLDVNHLNVILPFFETKAFHHTKSLEIGLDYSYLQGCIYNVALMQEDAPYNDYLNRNCNKGWTKFKIVTYNDTVFNCLYTNEFGYLLRQNQVQISQIETISAQISTLLDNSKLTLETYERNADKVFFNEEKKTALLYRVITSQQDYHGSHMDEVDELYNYTSLHLFWEVDFKHKTTKLNIFEYAYDDHTFIKEHTHSMETKFLSEMLDLAYYEDFFKKTVDKLIHCHYPSRKLIELLDSAIDLEGFDGTLTEDQYHLFKMMTI